MSNRKFPQPGTPLYDQIVARVEKGEDYRSIAESIGMTWRSFKDACCNYGIHKKQSNYQGILPPKHNFPKSATWEEHLDTVQNMDRLIAFHQRTPSKLTIEVKTNSPVIRAVSADWHLGMFGVDYKSFREDVDFMQNEDLKVNIGGDGYHNIIEPSKMGSGHNQAPISVQKGLYVLTLEKLKDKIDTIRTGNHNYWTTLAEGEDWDMEITRKIKLVYLKHFGVVYYKVGKMVSRYSPPVPFAGQLIYFVNLSNLIISVPSPSSVTTIIFIGCPSTNSSSFILE